MWFLLPFFEHRDDIRGLPVIRNYACIYRCQSVQVNLSYQSLYTWSNVCSVAVAAVFWRFHQTVCFPFWQNNRTGTEEPFHWCTGWQCHVILNEHCLHLRISCQHIQASITVTEIRQTLTTCRWCTRMMHYEELMMVFIRWLCVFWIWLHICCHRLTYWFCTCSKWLLTDKKINMTWHE